MRRFLLALLLLLVAVPAQADWQEARTKHFIIYSQQKPDELRTFAERLERFDTAVRAVRGMDDPPLTDGGKMTIYLLPSVAEVRELAGAPATSGILGFYMGRAEGSVAFLSHREQRRQASITRDDVGIPAEHVFQHEYMHHLMLSDQKTPLSSWLVEGTAEFFGTAGMDAEGGIKFGAPPQARGWAVMENQGLSAEELLASVPAKTPLERESVYGKGWLLTHLLAFNKARSGQLTRYLTGMQRGMKPLDAAREAFGDLRQLDQDLSRYARANFQAIRVAPGPKPQVTVRALTAGEAAILPVRIRSDRGVDKKTGPDVAADARRIAATYPNDPFVQGVLAEAEFDVENYAATIAAADRALAVQPNNVQALIYRGRAVMEMGKKDPAKADWAEVRRWFVRANRADVENAEPLWLFYQTYAAVGQAPPKSAIDGLLYAQALSPQDRGLRLATVRRLLHEDKPAQAEPMFATLVFDPHLSITTQPLLMSVLDKIKAKDAKGALAIMDEEDAKAKAKAKAEAGRKS
jgi:tetratricopeptide (TPR) repeat protein